MKEENTQTVCSSSRSEEFFERGRERADKRFENDRNLHQSVQECWKLIDELSGRKGTRSFMDFTADELSGKAGRLALLKSYIGAEASKAHCKTNNSYIYKKFQESWQRKSATEHLEKVARKLQAEGKKTSKAVRILSKDIDAEVMKRVINLEQDWAFNQEYSDVIKNLFDSIHWILTSIGWRIKEINADRYAVQFQDNADTSIMRPLDPPK